MLKCKNSKRKTGKKSQWNACNATKYVYAKAQKKERFTIKVIKIKEMLKKG